MAARQTDHNNFNGFLLLEEIVQWLFHVCPAVWLTVLQ